MRNLTSSRAGLSAIVALLLALFLPAARVTWAAAASEATSLLSSQLPAGVTLSKASFDQLAAAINTAVSQRPDEATSIIKVAILAKTPKQGKGKLNCPDVIKLVHAAVAAAPNEASEIVTTAASLVPDCADALNDLLNHPLDYGLPAGGYGFGVGLGGNFPGSPGFTGSAPAGAVALPPTPPAVTNTTND